MLRLTDEGAIITLNGKPTFDMHFLVGGVLLVGAIAIIVISMFAQVKITIGAIFLLACACLAWNYHNRTKSIIINTGELTINSHQIIHATLTHTLSKQAQINQCGDSLCIIDNKTIIIKGFADNRHAKIAYSILTGQRIGRRLVNVKMQSSQTTVNPN